jgi:hypothetical protein
MHAVVGMVLLDPERTEEQLGFLRDVIAPNVERRPSLVRAFWTYDPSRSRGTVMVVFQNEDAAVEFRVGVEADEAGRSGLGVKFETLQVLEVIAESSGPSVKPVGGLPRNTSEPSDISQRCYLTRV